MTDRLNRITTRTGDQGTTGLADGRRVPKTHARIDAIGDIDELNSALGLVLAHPCGTMVWAMLSQIQHRLFDLGAEIAVPGSAKISDDDVAVIDSAVQLLNASLPPLREFLLPGGTPAAAHCHLARAICRRAERALWRVHAQDPLNAAGLRYLNRLSDLLFVAARTLARDDGGEGSSWVPKERPG